MNSKKSNLETEELKDCQEFNFTWSIHNYNFCTLEEDKYIESPEFVIDFLGDSRWCLWLYPKGDYARGFISCYLRASGKVFACYFTLSIRKSNGQFKEIDKISYDEYCTENGCSEFISHEELSGPDGFLLNDTFTIQCRIFKIDTDEPTSVNCYADSRIKILKLNYDWTLKDLEVSNQNSNKTTDITHCFGKIPSLKMHVLNFGFFDEDAIHFKLELGAREEKFYFVVCLIHVLDADGRVVHSARGDHIFRHSKTTEHFNFPLISKEKLYLNKNMYLPKGRLTIRCEISFSSDNQLETLNYRKTYVTGTTKTDVIEQDQDGQELWVQRMTLCYIDGKFSDFIIRTTEKQFNVHKTILCTHSEVFNAMFENDMKERESGEVEIKDLDHETVSKMLMFLYTNIIEDLDCDTAQNLYFAADKYGIKALRKKCSNHLKRSLDVSNVCDVLLLADTHQDQELKSLARDFIDVYSQEVIVSDGWKSLLDTNPSLISEILQSLFCKKFLRA